MMKKIKFYFTLVMTCTMLSCNALKMAPYDQYSYQKTIAIKVEAEKLIEKATTNYSDNSTAIEDLKTELTKITAYEKYKPNNDITYKMWLILTDSEKNLLSGFLKRWEEKKKLSPVFINEAKAQIVEVMNLLIQYEGKKEVAIKNKLLQIIAQN